MPKELLPDSILKARKAAIKKNGAKSVLPMSELNARWKKKKEHLEKIASNIRSLRYNLTRDLKSEDEKTRLTALVISVMDCTAERVGNNKSAKAGHFGVTVFRKKHIRFDGNTAYFRYTGKKGVPQNKKITDKLIVDTLRKAVKDSPSKFIFTTSDGFRIHDDKINRYLEPYHITAKDIRGYCANTYILNRLKNYEIIKASADLPEEKAQKKRKAVFNKAVKYAAGKVGHGPATLKSHYLMPEVSRDYIQFGRIINLSDFYSKGGEVKGKDEPLNKPTISVKEKKPCGCKHKLNKPLITKLKKGGLIAPNGKPSNLTPEQYELVRTPSFKKWFGDWENNPKNASKVVDENGEPLVVYHASPFEFNVFDKEKTDLFGWHFGTKKAAEKVGKIRTEDTGTSFFIRPFFLDVKNPYLTLDIKFHNIPRNLQYQIPAFFDDFNINKKEVEKFNFNKEDKPVEYYKDKIQNNKKWDGFWYVNKYENKGSVSWIVNDPAQIKLADGSNTTFDLNNPDVRFQKGGLIAPNGKPSNLTPEQYELVRTSAFKKWFGDWENDPKNASKVVDENGEPLVVYHGSYFNFNIFDRDKLSVTLSPDKKELFNTGGFYFSNDKEISLSYKNRRPNKYQDKTRWLKSYLHKHKVRSFFLRLMNPLIIQGEGKVWNNIETVNGLPHSTNDISYRTYTEGKHDGVIFYNIHDTADDNYVLKLSNSFVVFDSTQIKLADGTNTTFDLKNPDVRFKKGGEVEKSEVQKQIDAYIKEGIFIGKGDKVYTGTVNIDRFFGEKRDIFPSQLYVDKSGVRKWKKRIKAGERPAILVGFKPIDDRFHIIDAHHRLTAYDQLGFTEVPVIDKSGKLIMNDKEKVSLEHGGELNKNKVKIFYLHGIGATPESDHVTDLAADNVEIIAPYLDYNDGKQLFHTLSHLIERIKPDGIVGHSAGGFLAFYLSNKFRIPSLMFNPAFNCETKSMHLIPEEALEMPFFNRQVAVVGSQDEEVSMADQLSALESVGVEVFIEKIGHDVPDDIKLKYFNHFIEWFRNFDESEKSTNFTGNTTNDELQHIISGQSEIGNGTSIQKALNFLRSGEGSSPQAKGSKQYKQQETERLKSYIAANNLWISETDLKNFLDEGAEQQVYFVNSDFVIKTNSSVFYNSWEDYFVSLLLHNYYFPDTAYELIGFIEKEDQVFAVVKQPFVQITEKTNLDLVRKFMLTNGFQNLRNNDYYNPELGIILEDLHGENVLTEDGILQFIDTVFYIQPIKKLQKGGLIAPNGKPSNLTPDQYKLVRTPEFKNWFGDWENDPENSSKVVDDNGEPLVVYHGSRSHDITEFREDKMRAEDYDAPFNGFWFSDDKDTSPAMVNPSKTYQVFLNLRNDCPSIVYKKVRKEIEEGGFENLNNARGYGDATRLKLKELGYDGVIWEYPPEIDIEKFDRDGRVEFRTVRGKKYWIEKGEDHGGVELFDNFVGFVTGYYDVPDLINSFDKVFVVFSANQIKLADGTNTTFDPNNPDIRFEKGGLIAPNGKPSNLTPDQYKLVRTPEFKNWFGDWENDPENSSKVVDNNGEPMVVYHGTHNEFTIFDTDKFNSIEKSGDYIGEGFFFSSEYHVALRYAKQAININKQSNLTKIVILSCFLKTINPVIIRNADDGEKFRNKLGGELIYFKTLKRNPKLLREKLQDDGYDGLIDYSYGQYAVFDSNQIKLADGTNTTFDPNNPNIRFKRGGKVDTSSVKQKLSVLYKRLKAELSRRI